jgi:hypothetical protein
MIYKYCGDSLELKRVSKCVLVVASSLRIIIVCLVCDGWFMVHFRVSISPFSCFYKSSG